jgi:FAS-associated factor 2
VNLGWVVPWRFFSSLFWKPRNELTPGQAVDALEDLLRTKYAASRNEGQLPVFVRGSISEALNQAKQRFKFLLVYLHSDYHQDTARFCRDVLSSNGVVDFLNENFIVWAADVSTIDGYHVSTILKAGSFPFLSLLCHYGVSTPVNPALRVPQLGGGICMCDRIDGFVSADDLVARLSQGMELFEPIIAAARADAQQRVADQRLRQEQDEAFQQSLATDREKERRRREEQERIKAEEAAAARAVEEALALEEAERLREEEMKKAREMKARQLPAEPLASDPQPTTLLAIRIGASGERLQRRFYQNDSIDLVYDFVESKEEEIPHEKLEIVTHFPKKKFDRGSGSLKELGLTPQAQIFIQERFDA